MCRKLCENCLIYYLCDKFPENLKLHLFLLDTRYDCTITLLAVFLVIHVPLQAVKLKMDLEKEHARGRQVLNKMNARVRQLEEQVNEFELQHMQQTQVIFLLNVFSFLSKICWRSLFVGCHLGL